MARGKLVSKIAAWVLAALSLAALGPAPAARAQEAPEQGLGAGAPASIEGGGSSLDRERARAPESLEGEGFEQSAFGPKLSALAVAAEQSDWERWIKKWVQRKGGKLPNVPEVRVATVGSKIELAVILATKDKEFEAPDDLSYVVSIYRPDGKLQESLSPSLCLAKGSKLGAGFMGVCEMVLKFELEPHDPKGQWVFRIDMEVPGQKPLVFGTSFEAY